MEKRPAGIIMNRDTNKMFNMMVFLIAILFIFLIYRSFRKWKINRDNANSIIQESGFTWPSWLKVGVKNTSLTDDIQIKKNYIV